MSELNMEHIKEILHDESLTNKQKIHTILSVYDDHQGDPVVDAIMQCITDMYTVSVSHHPIAELPPHIGITSDDIVEDNDIPDIDLHPDMKWYRDKILNNDEWTLDQKVRAVIYNDRDLATTFYIGNDDVCTMLMVFEAKRIGCQKQMNTHPKGPEYVRNIAKIWQGLIDMLVEYDIEYGPDAILPDEILIDA